MFLRKQIDMQEGLDMAQVDLVAQWAAQLAVAFPPVVNARLDIVVASESADAVRSAVESAGWSCEFGPTIGDAVEIKALQSFVQET